MSNYLLLFDGDCLFCHRIAYFLAKADKRNYFAFVATNSNTGKELIAKKGFETLISQTVIVMIGEKHFTKSAAVYTFLKATDTYPIIRFFIRITPTTFADAIYDVIAKYRKKLITNKCPIPEPEIRKKFLP